MYLKTLLFLIAPENPKFCDQITSFSSTKQSGTVNMKSVKNFIGNKPYRVLRLRMAIPQNFSDLVDAQMNYDGIYSPLTNNCLHFALGLLGVGKRQKSFTCSFMKVLYYSKDLINVYNSFICSWKQGLFQKGIHLFNLYSCI